jgi:hypothetical protein
VIGPVTRLCEQCSTEAWDEVGRRYRQAGKPAGRKENETMHDQLALTGLVEHVEGELADPEEESRAALALRPPALFDSDPGRALQRQVDLAALLVDVVRSRQLSVRIGGREHLTAAAWTTLGGLVNVFAVVVWTRPNETGDGYLARVEARTLDGRVCGAAESECSRVERTWANRDPYALRSMAQTRAIGRALRAPLGQIVVLAGYEPAGAEEIPDAEEVKPAHSAHRPGPLPDEAKPTEEQITEMRQLLETLETVRPETDWKQHARDLIGVPSHLLTRAGADALIDQLRKELEKER